jgi:hypothetical protein
MITRDSRSAFGYGQPAVPMRDKYLGGHLEVT